jgi:hypothetical protein
MASISFDLDFGIPANTSAFASIAMDGDEYVSCSRCGHGGCDIRVFGCGCTVHAVRTDVDFYVRRHRVAVFSSDADPYRWLDLVPLIVNKETVDYLLA